MNAEEVAELKVLFATDHRSIVLDLRDVRLQIRDAVDRMKLENSPAYVREWMERQKDCQTDLRTQRSNNEEGRDRNRSISWNRAGSGEAAGPGWFHGCCELFEQRSGSRKGRGRTQGDQRQCCRHSSGCFEPS